jgi:plasmid stabilization system protein ParE
MSGPRLKLKVLDLASKEISDQVAFYKKRSGPELSGRWRGAVNQAISTLRTLPERGALVDPGSTDLRNIRRLPIEGFPKHLIFYRFDAPTRFVIVLRVIHGARDLNSLLESGPRE